MVGSPVINQHRNIHSRGQISKLKNLYTIFTFNETLHIFRPDHKISGIGLSVGLKLFQYDA